MGSLYSYTDVVFFLLSPHLPRLLFSYARTTISKEEIEGLGTGFSMGSCGLRFSEAAGFSSNLRFLNTFSLAYEKLPCAVAP